MSDWQRMDDEAPDYAPPQVDRCPECNDWVGVNPFCGTCDAYKEEASE